MAALRIVQLLSHSIEEHDQLALYTSMGVEAVSIGGYINPATPHDNKRGPVDGAPYYPHLQAAVDALGTRDNLGAAQERIPDAYLDWLGDDGVIIMHHYLDRMIGDWPRLRDWMRGSAGRRIVWRTVGQSVEWNERSMAPLRRDGLSIVRYSPKESAIPGYCGSDALIRFAKDPAEWYGWTGEDPTVIQFAQDFLNRTVWCNRPFFEEATHGLPRAVYGPGSEALPYGGGTLSYDAMRARMRSARAYITTGTQPASYVLNLIEAMMSGMPVVSIGPGHMNLNPYGPLLYEGHELTGWTKENGCDPDDPAEVRGALQLYLNDPAEAAEAGAWQRRRAIELFGIDTIRAQWAAFLGVRVAVPA